VTLSRRFRESASLSRFLFTFSLVVVEQIEVTQCYGAAEPGDCGQRLARGGA
jgi:hypothetical protein